MNILKEKELEQWTLANRSKNGDPSISDSIIQTDLHTDRHTIYCILYTAREHLLYPSETAGPVGLAASVSMQFMGVA